MAISQNTNIDEHDLKNKWLCNGAKLPFQYPRPVELAHYCTCFSDADIQFVNLSALFVNETPRYLNFSDYFSGTPSIWREHCFGCLGRLMVSVFVVLIFISATELAIENLSRTC